MLDLHGVSNRIALVMGLSLFAISIAPTASAVEPVVEGGNGSSTGGGAPVDPGATFEVSAGGFDWGLTVLLVLVGLIVFVTVLAAQRAAGRRGGRPPGEHRLLVRKENGVFQPDTNTSRQLVREHQAELKRNWQRVRPGRPDIVESRRRHLGLRLAWLRSQLRPANHTS